MSTATKRRTTPEEALKLIMEVDPDWSDYDYWQRGQVISQFKQLAREALGYLTLLKTIPSGSHNAPYTPELGEHWPAGQLFKLLDKRHQRTMKKYFHVKPGCVVVQQIGGEEVNVSLPVARMPELFGISVNEDGEPT